MIDAKKIAEWKELVDTARTSRARETAAFLLRDAADEALPALLAERASLLALLREVDKETRAAVPCPICREPDVPHAPDCRLAAALRGDGEGA